MLTEKTKFKINIFQRCMSTYNRDEINFASKALNKIDTSKMGIVQTSVEISLRSDNVRIIFSFPDSIILTEFDFNTKFAFNGRSSRYTYGWFLLFRRECHVWIVNAMCAVCIVHGMQICTQNTDIVHCWQPGIIPQNHKMYNVYADLDKHVDNAIAVNHELYTLSIGKKKTWNTILISLQQSFRWKIIPWL